MVLVAVLAIGIAIGAASMAALSRSREQLLMAQIDHLRARLALTGLASPPRAP